MSSHTLGTVLLVTSLACTLSTYLYRRRDNAVMRVLLVAAILLALSGIVLDSVFIKILGAYATIAHIRSMSKIADAKDRAR